MQAAHRNPVPSGSLEDVADCAPLVQTAGPAAQLTLAQLRALGVRRTDSALARAAFTALHHAADDMLNKGSFAYARTALSGEVLDGVMGEDASIFI